MKILIKTAGRTGSHIITDWLRNYHQFETVLDEFYNNQQTNIVVHSQLDFIPDDPHNWIFVSSKRKNLFDQAISRHVAYITKQSTTYKKNITKKNSIKFEFVQLMGKIGSIEAEHRYFDHIQQKYNWQSKHTFYYEDLVKGTEVLKTLVSRKENYYQSRCTEASPYNYKFIVKDYETMYKKYKEFNE